MKPYRVRRAGKRWREDAPDYILDCFDNPTYGDRYTVLFVPETVENQDHRFVPYLGMDGAPSHPQGVSMWGELKAHEAADFIQKSGMTVQDARERVALDE